MAESNEIVKYTLAQVKEHNKSSDLWIIIHDRVYNLTRFLSEHPGGREVLEEVAGKNATKAFDDIGHSKDAIAQMKQYCIGEISDAERDSKEKEVRDSTSSVCSGPLGAAGALLYKGISCFRSK